MGSQSVEIIRQGIWASLTGGWYYDPHQSVFCNTFHLYLWLYLLCVPFCVYLYASEWWIIWLVHLALLAIISLGIKGTNYILHNMFDTGEVLEEEVIPESASTHSGLPSLSTQRNIGMAGHVRTSSFEALEMQVINNQMSANENSQEHHSREDSVVEAIASCSSHPSTVTDFKVEVHHKESSGSEEGSLKKNYDVNDGRIPSYLQEGHPRQSSSTCSLSSRNFPECSKQRSLDLSLDEEEEPIQRLKSKSSLNTKTNFDETPSSSQPLVYKITEIKLSKGNKPTRKAKRKSSSRICRTPDHLLKPISNITEERSVSAPSCYVEDVYPTHNTRLKNTNHPKGHSSSKLYSDPDCICIAKDNLEMSPKRHKKEPRPSSSRDSYHETEEDSGTTKESESPLLNRPPNVDPLMAKSNNVNRKNRTPRSSKTYHPMVCRTTSVAKASASSGYTKDSNLKVTTLTFENIYADEESSSDNTPSFVKVSTSSSEDNLSRCEGAVAKGVDERTLKDNLDLKSGLEGGASGSSITTHYYVKGEPSDALRQEGLKDDLSCHDEKDDTISDSSCPDIDWLFYHSESDSEFTNVIKRPSSSLEQKGDDEDEENSWTVVRSSPECYSDLIDDPPLQAKKETPSENVKPPTCSTGGGAIPKQRRRQGVVVNETVGSCDDSNGGHEAAAGVTMDLVRKMLDVFSSYPENRPRDIKKLLVLVSLEQDRRSTSSKDQDDNCKTPDDEDTTPTLSPSDTIHSISTLTSPTVVVDTSSTQSVAGASGSSISSQRVALHRKPAVRRRKQPTESSSVSSDNVGVEFSSGSKLRNDYQTTLSGAVSFFGCDEDDEEESSGDGSDSNKKNSFKLKPNDPSSGSLPLSALSPALQLASSCRKDFGSSSSSAQQHLQDAIHLATCHDDTTNGAVHCFQDERGHWFTYTFNNSGMNVASAVMPMNLQRTTDLQSAMGAESHQRISSSKGSTTHHAPATIAKEDASLSSSSMSLCSGLTVVLDSQQNSAWRESSNKRELRNSSPLVSNISTQGGRLSPSIGRGIDRISHTSRSLPPQDPNHRRSSSFSSPPVTDSSQLPTYTHLLYMPPPRNPLQVFTSAIFDRISHGMHPSTSVINSDDLLNSFPPHSEVDVSMVKQLKFTTPAPQTVQYYKLRLFNNKSIKVKFDRLSLLSLLDKNISICETLLTVLLIIIVGILGCLVLFKGYYHEINVFIFCVVMASCQYSLFKSVQPDAASPTHGYNHVILYSRPTYFSLCCIIILSLDLYLNKTEPSSISFHLYGFELTNPLLLAYVKDFFLVFILFFPLIFSLGLLPQINTFFMYLLEQIDMHIFGGNATTSLSSAVYCVFRSCMVVLFLLGFAYGGLSEESGSQHILYSIFCALIVSISYHLSRSTANPSVLWQLIKKHMWPEELLPRQTAATTTTTAAAEVVSPVEEENPEEASSTPDDETKDPLPEKLRTTVTNRLTHDAIVCSLIALIVCSVHSSTVFTVLLQGQFPDLLISVWSIAGLLGLLNHYIIPQLRTQQPWMCIARPACMSYEYSQFEVYDAAKIMWFEKIYLWLCIVEKNVVYPVLFLCALTKDPTMILAKHPSVGTLMIVVAGLKGLRSVYSQPQFQYLIMAFTILFFNWDIKGRSESFLIDFFFMSIIFSKAYEFLLKLKFIVTYIAPWQITWGSAFHAFAQPFSVPHSAMLFIQAAISAVLSTPLNPILGSAIFVTSYVRPVKFWERDYNTKRMDQSNTRLSSLLEQNPGADDNNLNSIFYEHLTRSLQHSLCGDLTMGRWGPAVQGDCFVLASDNLNCLVHIIEVGNGLVTFQVRGLEFRGTYCQQREVEAISEGVEEDGGCCCCYPGHLPHMLSANATFNQRWLAWEVTATKYVLEGYSISDNSAISMFQMFELRKILITYYVKSIIFYTVQSPKLEEWLSNAEILTALEPLKEKKFADLDPTFHIRIDEDFDYKECGITRNSFCNVYLDWIRFCISKRDNKSEPISKKRDSSLVSLCLALSLLGRRALGPSSQCDNVEVFLQFLHSLFKGDIRLTCVRDEWIFADMELLRKIVSPAVRMSLRLHQDHFLLPDEYDNHEALHNAIIEHQSQLVICHEGDPAWRAAILKGRPSLLSLRHVNDDGEDKFKIIMLNKRHLMFRVIKINRECVRGLWAGQQQELVYLRNPNPERGSIQNAKQALRNIINSSCDQPIGYPIYVSPLTTSYTDTHKQYAHITGKTLTPSFIKNSVIALCNRLRQRCVEGCSSGSSGLNDECTRVPDSFQTNMQLRQVLSSVPLGVGPHLSQDGSPIGGLSLMTAPGSLNLGGSVSGHSISSVGSLQANRGSLMSTMSSNLIAQNKQSSTTLASLAGLLGETGTVRQESEGGSVGRGTEFPRRGEKIHHSRDSLLYYKKPGCSSGGREMVDPEWDYDLRPSCTGSVHSLAGPSSLGRSSPMSYCTAPQSLPVEPSRPYKKRHPSGNSWKQKPMPHRVRIIDANQVYDTLNLGRRIDVQWPDEWMRARGGRNFWGNWVPLEGMEGTVVHTWVPYHPDPKLRSHVDKNLVLVQIDDKFVPVVKSGVQEIADS